MLAFNGFRVVSFLILLAIALLFTPWHRDDILLRSNARILLLTAHPDDECMFFGPTITSLLSPLKPQTIGTADTRKETLSRSVPESELYSLCLSVGDADGLGSVRRDELKKSMDVLGLDERRRWVLNVKGLEDNFTVMWNTSLIADVVMPYVLANNITTILTFDPRGISSHPNHMSLYYGVAHLLSQLSSRGHAARAYALVSIPTASKYLGPAAPLIAKLNIFASRILSKLGVPSGREGSADGKDAAVFVAGIREYLIAVRAMLQHRSQLVWFRWLYVMFSRYMWVNEWVSIPANV